MQGSAPLSKEDFFLVLDIYLGGVSGAIVKNGTIEHSTHNKTIIPSENTVPSLLSKVEPLLQKTLEDLIRSNTISKTYIFIDTPLSYTESAKLIYQKDDSAFFEKKSKEIENSLELPASYKTVLGDYSQDGIAFEHPPQKHTINGYTTTNLKLDGIREAFVVQQWIQREVYSAIENVKRTYEMGELVFLSEIQNADKNVCVLGDVISSFAVGTKNILIGAGSALAIAECAETHNHSVVHIESVLRSVEKGHGTKDVLYKTVEDIFSKAFTQAFKHTDILEHKPYVCTYVGQSYMLPVVQDALSSFKNITLGNIYTGKDARLTYIIKNKVQ